MRPWKTLLAALVLTGVALAVPAEVRSAVRVWDDGAAPDNDWFHPENWNPDGSPDPSDDLTVGFGTPRAASTVTTGDGGSITIDGAGTAATFDENLQVGVVDQWAPGALVITNGGYGENSIGYIAYGSGSQGTVTVDGPGSEWHNRGQLYVGYDDIGTLAISNGGLVKNTFCRIGQESSARGTVTLTGTDSKWENSQSVYVGYSGTGTLNIGEGASVENTYGFVGVQSGSEGTVRVDGAGSTWTNDNELHVGDSGTGTLEISDGGSVSNTVGFIAAYSGSDGTVTVGGSGSTWSNDSLYVGGRDDGVGGTGTLTVQDGGEVNVTNELKVWPTGTVELLGSQINTGSFIVSPGTFTHHDGTLTIVGGPFNPGTAGYTIEGAAAEDLPTVKLTDGATCSLAGNLTVGNQYGGALEIRSRSSVTTASGEIGSTSGSQGAVTVDGYVDGTPSTWTNHVDLCVGRWGTGTLEVTNGGSVVNRHGHIGLEPGPGGTVMVDGTAADGSPSTWNNSGTLHVGYRGTGTLEISGGGRGASAIGVIGNALDSQGAVTVDGTAADGTPSTWNNSLELYVGGFGTGRLDIKGGGHVDNRTGYIGLEHGPESTVTVDGTAADGTPSTWNNRVNLSVGHRGTGRLEISGGGSVANIIGYIGLEPSSDGRVTVDGAGSMWDNTAELYVGYYGIGTLDVTGGGRVSNRIGCIGYNSVSEGTVTVDGTAADGTPSTWENTQELYVGSGAIGTLEITGGGRVSNTLGYIGFNSVSEGTVTVDGTAANGTPSTWNNSADLVVGNAGNADLIIRQGGSVGNQGGCIALAAGSEGTVTVDGTAADGTPSTWNNRVNLSVGHRGTGRLEISGGGSVANIIGYIALEPPSDGTVTVAGAGSTWTNDLLYVGGSSTAAGGPGVLTVQTGGTVDAGTMLTLWPTGTVNLNGGTVRAAEFDLGAGTFNFNSGTLNYAENLTAMPGDLLSQLLGPARTLSFAKHVRVDGTTTLEDVLTLDDGTFSTGSLVNPEFLNFNRGTFNLTGDDLSVSPGGLFGPTLTLSANQVLNVANTTTIDASGELELRQGLLASGSLSNSGLIRGEGRIDAPFDNGAAGRVSVSTGERLALVGPGNSNDGQINVTGGIIEVTGPLTNQPAGTISGRGAVVFDDVDGLTNHGKMNFGGGTDLYGKVVNGQEPGMGTDGEITVSGGASVAFHGDVVHNGVKFKVADHANVVFFGQVSGDGDFTGGGGVFVEGSAKPGNSTAVVSFGGDLAFGSDATLEIELDSPVPGSGHDQLDVVGQVDLGGAALDALLGYTPGRGDQFVIINNRQTNPIIGQFAGLPDDSRFLLDGYRFGIDYQGGDGNDVALFVPVGEITGRYVFYNNSSFDGRNATADEQDDLAIAPDKASLMPGETATFANYTSFSQGINGVIVDILDLCGTPTEEDFLFKIGNSDDPDSWSELLGSPSITVREGEGAEDADRVTLIWDDNAIQKQWLQITVLANGNTGLLEDDVFYFGNAVGESGNSATDAKVNAYDMLGARDNQRTFIHPATLDFPYDYNRDARVNAYDMLIARDNQTHFLNDLNLITVPGIKSGELAAVPEPATLVMLAVAAFGLLLVRRRWRA